MNRLFLSIYLMSRVTCPPSIVYIKNHCVHQKTGSPYPPPHYFNVIRHYGLSASRVKTAYKTITDKLLGQASGIKTAKNWRERQTDFLGKDPLLCNICQTVMVFVTSHIPNPLTLVKVKLQSVFS